ncbi:MAG: CBS domain-containing protein [Epulopiscium sp.]|nr:CBS domain-containing protein [Candidatus Epulonipiscium sp.]
MKIRDIMNNKVHMIMPQDTLEKALSIMESKKVNGLPVVNEDKNLVGFIVKADIYRFLSVTGHYETCPVDWAMSKDVITAMPDESIKEAAKRLREHNIIGMPVIERGKVIGMVTLECVVDSFIANE